jgi:hypothetical protein
MTWIHEAWVLGDEFGCEHETNQALLVHINEMTGQLNAVQQEKSGKFFCTPIIYLPNPSSTEILQQLNTFKENSDVWHSAATTIMALKKELVDAESTSKVGRC